MTKHYCASVLLLLTFAVNTSAADWPQWRFDAQRCGASAQDGPAQGNLLWTADLGQPDPAYDHQFRMCADAAYAPVAAEGLLFVPSNAADHVAAFGLKTGQRCWRFFTEGPVRFAPAYNAGSLYFGADDGRLYCVNASTGELRWKRRAAADHLPDARMLVNGRMCSRWPLRGAPVIADGVVYAGAGIWPEEGVYVSAFDAATGELRWQSDALSFVENGMSDHGNAYDLSLPPHGYLAVIDGKLAVPSGRTLAAWFDLETGEMEPYTCYYVKTNPPRGTWSIFGTKHYAVQGGNWFATRPDSVPLPGALKEAVSPLYWSKKPPENELLAIEKRPFLRADTYNVHGENFYTAPILTDDAIYQSEFDDEEDYIIPRGHTHIKRHVYDKIVARDLTRPRWTTVKQRHFAYNQQVVEAPRLEFPVLWEMKSPLKVLAQAGSFLYAGGENTIAAIRIPPPGGRPVIAWQAPVSGYPINALVADGILAVSTDTGAIHCFGELPGNAAQPAPAAQPLPAPTVTSGYALQIGWSGVEPARNLAEEQGFDVVVLEPDATIVAAARNQLADAGQYGRKIQVIEGSLATLEFSPCWAERIIFGSGHAPTETAIPALLELLHPKTGRMELPANLAAQRIAIDERFKLSNVEDAPQEIQRTVFAPGAADWTHEAAGAGNTFTSQDTLQWPLGVLWYSGDIDRFFTPATHFQHERTPHPLVAGGRMFLITGHYLHAIDIYTGRYLWKRELPLTEWMRGLYYDSRAAGRPTERSYVAARDEIYVVTGKEIHAYDTQTGEPTHVINVPEQFRAAIQSHPLKPEVIDYRGKGAPLGWKATDYKVQTAPEWTQVRLWNDLIFAMLGPNLAVFDRRSGELVWSRPTTKEATTFAIGENTLYGLDFNLPPNTRRGPATTDTTAMLFALDPATGEIKWERDEDLNPQTGLMPKLANPWNLPSMPALVLSETHGLLLVNVDADKVWAFAVQDGTTVWHHAYHSSGYQRGHMASVGDCLLLAGANGFAGALLDIRTGEPLPGDVGIPSPRTCGKMIGNANFLAYRDAATELYDVRNNRMIGFNSIRAGCTTSFFPAGGVMNAPMLAHGCVCNYPMFASTALYHMPGLDALRPEIVRDSWQNQAAPHSANTPKSYTPKPIDSAQFTARNSEISTIGPALRLRTALDEAGYAIKQLATSKQNATFAFTVNRGPAPEGEKRHGNAFFLLGSKDNPAEMIQCVIYFGGRASLGIKGPGVHAVEQTADFSREFPLHVNVTITETSVLLEVNGQTIRTTREPSAITHYGYGGSNVDNLYEEKAGSPN